MRLAACGIFGSVIAMGSADALSGPIIVQYGALAILGGAVLYLLKYAIPSILKAQKDERTALLADQERARHDFCEALAGVSRSVDNMAIVISGARRSVGP